MWAQVAPQHGFTIASIMLSGDEENVLWNPPNASFAALPVADLGPSGKDSIDHFDRVVIAGGWFPMCPTAGPPGSDQGRWMHGEAPRLQWTVVDQSEAHVAAVLTTPSTGIHLERIVTVHDDTVRADTRMVNVSGKRQAITFGEHPCFARQTFASGVIDASPHSAQVPALADPVNALLRGDREMSWPLATASDGRTVDVSQIPECADQRHDHISLEGVAAVKIRGPRHTVDVEWDGVCMPHALLWQHFSPPGSPWPGDVFAVEPMSAPGRTLDDAIASQALTYLDVDGSLETWASIRVRPA